MDITIAFEAIIPGSSPGGRMANGTSKFICLCQDSKAGVCPALAGQRGGVANSRVCGGFVTESWRAHGERNKQIYLLVLRECGKVLGIADFDIECFENKAGMV